LKCKKIKFLGLVFYGELMITLISPAKINLFLNIRHLRSDGYHELASLFQTISLHDTLQFTLSDHSSFTCNNPTVPLDDSNLILKAVNLFKLRTNLKFCISIHLEKKIPMQAGLGGGSSNAATTLYALNELFFNPLTLDELILLGAELGSDIPFFFSQGTAYCTGRGEIVNNQVSLPSTDLTIVKPTEGLSTPLVFKEFNLCDNPLNEPLEALSSFYSHNPHYFNDLEIPAFKVMPSLKTLKINLQNAGFHTVLMSGSGSSFFCLGNAQFIDSHDLTINQKAFFINREKNNWYENKKNLQ
jgi:4-diphosphocytidyl-2-C-methyl-D-erythritol kinase